MRFQANFLHQGGIVQGTIYFTQNMGILEGHDIFNGDINVHVFVNLYEISWTIHIQSMCTAMPIPSIHGSII